VSAMGRLNGADLNRDVETPGVAGRFVPLPGAALDQVEAVLLRGATACRSKRQIVDCRAVHRCRAGSGIRIGRARTAFRRRFQRKAGWVLRSPRCSRLWGSTRASNAERFGPHSISDLPAHSARPPRIEHAVRQFCHRSLPQASAGLRARGRARGRQEQGYAASEILPSALCIAGIGQRAMECPVARRSSGSPPSNVPSARRPAEVSRSRSPASARQFRSAAGGPGIVASGPKPDNRTSRALHRRRYANLSAATIRRQSGSIDAETRSRQRPGCSRAVGE